MPGILYTSGDLRRLEEAAAVELRRLKKRDAAAEAVMLTGSNLLCGHLRKNLAGRLGGLFNVHFMIFPDLVRMIEIRSGRPGLDPIPAAASRVLLEETVRRDVPKCFAEVASTEGFAQALESTFTDLAEGGCGPGDARRIIESGDPVLSGDRVRGVMELYARYRESVESSGGDTHSRFEAAGASSAGALKGCSLFAYGFYDLNETQFRMLLQAGGEGPSAFFIPWRDDPAFRFALPLIERLESAGYRREHLEASGEPPGTALFSAPDAVEEAREIARRVIETKEEGGPDFADSAVIPWSRGGWLPLREALVEAGIPFYSTIGSKSTADPVRLAAARLLDLLCGEGSRAELVDFLISEPVEVPAQDGPGSDPLSLWVRLSAGEGMSGEAGWIEENRRLVEKLERHERESGVDAGRSGTVRHAVRIVSVIEEARAALQGCTDWKGFSGVLAGAVSGLFGGGAEGALEVIEGLAELDEFSDSCDIVRFRRIASAALEDSGRHEGRPGEGVSVITAGEARGLGFEAVYLPGMNEGNVPGKARQDPFIKDSEREAIERVTGGSVRLSLRGGRLEESALILSAACGSASERLVCSWPRVETGGGRSLSPSSFLRHVPGLPASPAQRLEGSERIPLRGRPEGSEVPLDEADYDFLMAGRRLGKTVHYPSSPFFARGVDLIRNRWGTLRFTPWDGVFSSPGAVAEVEAAMAEKGWNLSATSLQSWAICPFAFLVEKLIGIEQVEEPERALTIDHLQRGTLTHEALERLYRSLSGARAFPLTDLTLPGAIEEADRVTRETLDGFESEEPVGNPLFWEYEREIIGSSIRELLAEEAAETGDSVPTLFEQWFGGDDPARRVTFEAGGRTLSFHGKIDRVDVSPDGGFTVIDYKTGSIRPGDQDMGGGSYLQMPVYLLAASTLLGVEIEKGRAMLRRVGAGGGRRRAVFSGGEWAGSSAEFARILEVIVGGIRSGVFFASPPGQGCDFCAARQACPTGRERLFARKAASDESARGYLLMRGIEIEP